MVKRRDRWEWLNGGNGGNGGNDGMTERMAEWQKMDTKRYIRRSTTIYGTRRRRQHFNLLLLNPY